LLAAELVEVVHVNRADRWSTRSTTYSVHVTDLRRLARMLSRICAELSASVHRQPAQCLTRVVTVTFAQFCRDHARERAICQTVSGGAKCLAAGRAGGPTAGCRRATSRRSWTLLSAGRSRLRSWRRPSASGSAQPGPSATGSRSPCRAAGTAQLACSLLVSLSSLSAPFVWLFGFSLLVDFLLPRLCTIRSVVAVRVHERRGTAKVVSAELPKPFFELTTQVRRGACLARLVLLPVWPDSCALCLLDSSSLFAVLSLLPGRSFPSLALTPSRVSTGVDVCSALPDRMDRQQGAGLGC
jgi:hypothetical protein